MNIDEYKPINGWYKFQQLTERADVINQVLAGLVGLLVLAFLFYLFVVVGV